jgi:hypothetical protein
VVFLLLRGERFCFKLCGNPHPHKIFPLAKYTSYFKVDGKYKKSFLID